MSRTRSPKTSRSCQTAPSCSSNSSFRGKPGGPAASRKPIGLEGCDDPHEVPGFCRCLFSFCPSASLSGSTSLTSECLSLPLCCGFPVCLAFISSLLISWGPSLPFHPGSETHPGCWFGPSFPVSHMGPSGYSSMASFPIPSDLEAAPHLEQTFLFLSRLSDSQNIFGCSKFPLWGKKIIYLFIFYCVKFDGNF